MSPVRGVTETDTCQPKYNMAWAARSVGTNCAKPQKQISDSPESILNFKKGFLQEVTPELPLIPEITEGLFMFRHKNSKPWGPLRDFTFLWSQGFSSIMWMGVRQEREKWGSPDQYTHHVNNLIDQTVWEWHVWDTLNYQGNSLVLWKGPGVET